MKRFLIVCVVLLDLPCPVFAGNLPDTGQTTSYATGDDGYYAPCNPQSYTKLDSNGNDLPDSATSWVMVRDNVTGLMWEIKDSKDDVMHYNNPHDADNTYTWYDSNPVTNGGNPGTPGDGTDTQDFIDTLNTPPGFGGFTDWRLPTVEELSFIGNSNITTAYFPNIVSSFNWSSTTISYGTPIAWFVYFNVGHVGNDFKFNYYYARAVRGGESGSFGDFVDNDDGTVTDVATGLMWQQVTAPGTYTWEQALTYCEDLTFSGYDDWRLPNRNELLSLADYSTYHPAIDTNYFPSTEVSIYWSSTTHVTFNTVLAWGVNFNNGYTISYDKSNSNYVRAVRAGQCGSFGDSDDDGISDAEDNCPNTHNTNQEDSYPPGGNGIGDACECEGNFDCDLDVDAQDVTKFLEDFGREEFLKPCTNLAPCNGDFTCDGDVDADDVTKFLEDFGREEFFQPCPVCVVGAWCVYP